jgi:hypothetical protein
MTLAKHPVPPSVVPVAGLREGEADSGCNAVMLSVFGRRRSMVISHLFDW